MSSDTALRDQRPSTADRQTALREFLRSRRARVKPEDVTNSSASARFLLNGDGKLLADSGVKIASQGPSTLDVTTTGYALEPRVTDARNGTSYDHADWGGPTITCG